MTGRWKAALLAGTLFAMPAIAQAQAPTDAEAAAIHDRILVLDSHADVLLPSTPKRYYLPDGGSRAALPHLEKGGVDAIVLAVAVGPGPRHPARTPPAPRQPH